MTHSTEPLHKKTIFILTVITFITFIVYSYSLTNGFVNWDDDVHLLSNPAVTFFNIEEMWSQTVNKVYIPLTTLSFAIEYFFFKDNPFIYHFNNLLLHIGVTLLIFYFCRLLKFNVVTSAGAALLFSIHPVHVESVAWITERKDVLCGFFYMLSLCFYLKYLHQKEKIFYGLSLVVCVLSMLAKPMALSLLLIYFLCDWYTRREKSSYLWSDKILYIIFIIPIAWMTYIWHARVPFENLSQTALSFVWSFSFYIKSFFVPGNFVLLYGQPLPVSMTNPEYLSAFIVFLAVIFALIVFRRNKVFLFSSGFFILTIFFVLRLDNTVDFNFVADRYLYIPSIGLSLGSAYLVDQIIAWTRTNKITQRAVFTILIFIVSILSLKTFNQTKVWQSGVTLWQHQMKNAPHVATALVYNKLGYALAREPDFDVALKAGNMEKIKYVMSLHTRAIKIKPDFANAHYYMGQLYERIGKSQEAINKFEETLSYQSNHFMAYYSLGQLYLKNDSLKQALEAFRKSIEIDPDNQYHGHKVIKQLESYKTKSLIEENVYHAEVKRLREILKQ